MCISIRDQLTTLCNEDLNTLTASLRVLRNLCAGSESNQSQIRESNLVGSLFPFLETSLKTPNLSAKPEPLWTFLKVTIQFLINFITNNMDNQDYLWPLLTRSSTTTLP